MRLDRGQGAAPVYNPVHRGGDHRNFAQAPDEGRNYASAADGRGGSIVALPRGLAKIAAGVLGGNQRDCRTGVGRADDGQSFRGAPDRNGDWGSGWRKLCLSEREPYLVVCRGSVIDRLHLRDSGAGAELPAGLRDGSDRDADQPSCAAMEYVTFPVLGGGAGDRGGVADLGGAAIAEGWSGVRPMRDLGKLAGLGSFRPWSPFAIPRHGLGRRGRNDQGAKKARTARIKQNLRGLATRIP